MSKRVSFMDRSVVAENREILKFNEALEREARREEAARLGVPYVEDTPRDDRRGRGQGRGPRSSGDGGRPPRAPREGREGREPREPRGPRPGEAELIAAGEAAPGWSDFAAAGRKLVDGLLRGRKPNPSARFAWEVVAGSQAPDANWDDVRARWTVVHDAILAEWVKTHPEDAPPPPKRKPKPRPARRPGAARTPKPGDEVGGAGEGAKPRRRRGARGKKPSDAAVATTDAPVAGDVNAPAAAVGDPPLIGDAGPQTAPGTSEQLTPPDNPSAPPEVTHAEAAPVAAAPTDPAPTDRGPTEAAPADPAPADPAPAEGAAARPGPSPADAVPTEVAPTDSAATSEADAPQADGGEPT